MSDKCLLCDKEQPVGEPWSWYEPEHLDFGFNLCPECDQLCPAEINKKFKEKYSQSVQKTKGCGKEFEFRLVYGTHRMKCGKKYQKEIRLCDSCNLKSKDVQIAKGAKDD